MAGGAEPVEYLAPRRAAEAEVRERGSRFLARLLPVAGAAEADAAIRRVAAADRDATHHCWARRLGWPPRERSSDAGEPSGTAGVPILRVLSGAGLSDALLVVSRWFGGVKLGKGGLARAYAAAAREAVAAAELVRRFPTVTLVLRLPYPKLGEVERLARPPEVEIVDRRFGARVALRLRVRDCRLPEVEEAMAALGVEVVGEEGTAPTRPGEESP